MSTPGPAASAPPPKAPISSDPAEIEREIALRQARLAATVDELTTRLSPKVIAQRTATSAQEKAQAAVRAEDGSLRVERIAAVAIAATAVLGWVIWRRRR
jgi:hypothetical protein